MTQSKNDKYIVTGASGYLGGTLARRLALAGAEVHGVSRRVPAELVKDGITCHSVDLSGNSAGLADIFRGARAVFHTAAKVDMWGAYKDFFDSNVTGTRNVIAASQAAGVTALVYTSSPSVVANGRDLNGVDENQPYPSKHLSYYSRTKAIAERDVLAANGSRGLRTLSLRPHLIFGPGDTKLIPTITAKARAGRLVRVGKGDNLTDVCFIEDCVEAHLQARKALEENPASAGRPYFISQGEPVNLWNWINEILRRQGLPEVARSVSKTAASAAAGILEIGARIIPGSPEPLFTRFLVCEMATSHFFSIEAAKKELGFKPRYSVGEAMDLTFGDGASQPIYAAG